VDIGLRGVSEGTRQRARIRYASRSARDTYRAAVVLLLVLLVIAATGWLLLSALSARPAVSPMANAFATRAFAINQFGYGAARLPWYDGGLAALQVAGYEKVTGALGRAPTVVTAAREAASVAVLLTAVALTVAARRLRMSGPAIVAVPLLFGLLPAALVLHRTADPTQLGVLWACVALALAGGGTRRAGTAVASGLYLVLAVATSPLVLVALVPLFTMLIWSGALGRFGHRVRRAVALAGLVLSALLVGWAATGGLPGSGAAAVPDLGPLDWTVGVAAIAAGVAALRVRWLRPLAVAFLVTAVAAAVSPDLRGSLLYVALPLGALVLPATVEAAVAAIGRRQEPWLPGRVVIVGALGVAAVLAWVPTEHSVREPVDGSRQLAVGDSKAWVLANLPSRPNLVVDDAMWACLVKSGYPADRLASASGVGLARPSWTWTQAAYAIGHLDALAGGARPVDAAQARSVPVARFGDDVDGIDARRVVTDPNVIATAQREQAARAAAGRALARNPRLTLDTKADALLGDGRLDARALAILAAVSGQHALRIIDFPVVPGEEAAAPRRLIAVSAVDDQAVGPEATATTALEQWLRAQQPPYRPAAIELSRLEGSPVLLLRYDALGSTGLLPP
jgi:hypothetical protein